ncbi:unnamed protein product, partial [Staurois parvus]
MLSNSETPQNLELHEPGKAVEKTKSPGVDPKQLAAELQKVSQQQTPSVVSSAMEKGSYIHSGTTSTGSSAVPSPGQPGSPSVSKKRHSSKSTEAIKPHSHPITGDIQVCKSQFLFFFTFICGIKHFGDIQGFFLGDNM